MEVDRNLNLISKQISSDIRIHEDLPVDCQTNFNIDTLPKS